MAKTAPPTKPAAGRGAWRAAIPLVLLVAIGVGVLASGVLENVDAARLVGGPDSLTSLVNDHRILSRVGFVLALAVAVATGVPGTIVLALAGGLLFGTIQGTLLGSVAVLAGSMVLYAAARRAFSAGRRDPPAIVQGLRERYGRHPVRHTFALRFVPVVPLGVMTMALAWLRCPPGLFASATWLGSTVSLAVEAAIGAGLGHTLGRGPITAANLANARLLVPLAMFVVISAIPPALKAWRDRKDH